MGRSKAERFVVRCGVLAKQQSRCVWFAPGVHLKCGRRGLFAKARR